MINRSVLSRLSEFHNANIVLIYLQLLKPACGGFKMDLQLIEECLCACKQLFTVYFSLVIELTQIFQTLFHQPSESVLLYKLEKHNHELNNLA